MRNLLKSVLQFTSAVVIVLTFLSYLAPQVNPSWFRGLVFFGTAFPWFLMANIGLMLFWLWKLDRFAIYHLGILLLGWQYVCGFIGFDLGKNPQPSNAFTVTTHNLGRMWPAKVSDTDYDKLAADYALVLQKNGTPDILCTQETRGAFYKALARKMGYNNTFNLKKGTVILSKFPMEGGGEVPFKGTKNSTLWVDVRIGKERVRIYNVHLQSNKVTSDTEKVLEGGEIDQEETWNEVGKVLRKVGGATRIRAKQARELREHINNCPYPVIVCGDFNDTPNSYVYRVLTEGMTDTFREKGFGLGTTFAGALPLLRIDYIVTDPGMKIFNCQVVHNKFSDHYPVFTTMSL